MPDSDEKDTVDVDLKSEEDFDKKDGKSEEDFVDKDVKEPVKEDFIEFIEEVAEIKDVRCSYYDNISRVDIGIISQIEGNLRNANQNLADWGWFMFNIYIFAK